jgi:hypothetical protein
MNNEQTVDVIDKPGVDGPESEEKQNNVVVIHRHDSGRAIWGVLVIFSGIMLLLNDLNIVPWSIWSHVWQYWPILLILLGFKAIIGSSVRATLILFILSFVTIGSAYLLALWNIGSPLTGMLPYPVTILLSTLGRFRI